MDYSKEHEEFMADLTSTLQGEADGSPIPQPPDSVTGKNLEEMEREVKRLTMGDLEITQGGSVGGEEEESQETVSVGWRFCPSDHDLIVYYLLPKNLNLPLPDEFIKPVDWGRLSPWEIHERYKVPGRTKETYFFHPRTTYFGEFQGCWSGTGTESIMNANNDIIGTRKTCVFHKGSKQNSKITKWFVHVFDIHDNRRLKEQKLGSWLLYKLFKTGGYKSDAQEIEEDLLTYDKHMQMYLEVGPTRLTPSDLSFSAPRYNSFEEMHHRTIAFHAANPVDDEQGSTDEDQL